MKYRAVFGSVDRMSSLNIYTALRNLPLLIAGILAGFVLAYALHAYRVSLAGLATIPLVLPFVIAALTGLAKTTTA
jgi:hypothetical protein